MKKSAKNLMIILFVMVVIVALVGYLGDINVLKEIGNIIVNFFTEKITGESLTLFN